ncbi:hypothetical protein [Catalinimonas niigatensis]|uniref:hypothetical protein n=1 Tax=Catalinimonas niigatensis TaxID=1397264 RepID=UPI0026668015|nr:hypothetical protein [Catalinimonas niigatensis]WPP52313.1 hypothetical protein PZB72_07960 [Catalinimonas niigatensis]
MMSALNSALVTGCLMLTWLIYVGMVIKFNIRLMDSSRYRFLSQIILLPVHQQILYTLFVFMGQLCPVIIYVGLLLGFGIYHQEW